MKRVVLVLIISQVFGFLIGQDKTFPEFNFQPWEVEAKLRFLASDELEGRRAGQRGNDIAARYLADHFQALGLQPAGDSASYFQEITLVEQTLPENYQLKLEGDMVIPPEDLLILSGEKGETSTRLVFAKYAWQDEETGYNDYEDIDVSGKIVLCLAGTPESTNLGPQDIYRMMESKTDLAKKHGAIGLIEITQFRFPFSAIKRYLSNYTNLKQDDPTMIEADGFIYGWSVTKAFSAELLKQLSGENGMAMVFYSDGVQRDELKSKNVLAIVEGTDTTLKDEYIMLSAHFDHVGMGKKANASRNWIEGDSIYNGARDNAIGTTALLMAAQALALKPAKRSILFVGWTAEEMGLLGSRHYAEHPTVPLHQIVYNLNVDGPGYNSTQHISIQGFEKTNADGLLQKAIQHFGLDILKNPVPEQKGFYRSDNITFARLGIPAISMHQGVLAHDEGITKYYHQAADEADSLDMRYCFQFCSVYSYAARLIANMDVRPYWLAGDEFEEAAKELYQQ